MQSATENHLISGPDESRTSSNRTKTLEGCSLIESIVTATLIILGTKDSVLPPDDAERFKADIRGSRVVTLADVGHLPQEEAPDGTFAAIKSLFN